MAMLSISFNKLVVYISMNIRCAAILLVNPIPDFLYRIFHSINISGINEHRFTSIRSGKRDWCRVSHPSMISKMDKMNDSCISKLCSITDGRLHIEKKEYSRILSRKEQNEQELAYIYTHQSWWFTIKHKQSNLIKKKNEMKCPLRCWFSLISTVAFFAVWSLRYFAFRSYNFRYYLFSLKYIFAEIYFRRYNFRAFVFAEKPFRCYNFRSMDTIPLIQLTWCLKTQVDLEEKD